MDDAADKVDGHTMGDAAAEDVSDAEEPADADTTPDDTAEATDTGDTSPAISADSSGDKPDAEEIRAGITETRAEISETINAIEEKLNPQHIKEQMAESARDIATAVGLTLKARGAALLTTIKRNPLPAAGVLVALVLVWWLKRRLGGKLERTSWLLLVEKACRSALKPMLSDHLISAKVLSEAALLQGLL